MKWDHVVMWLGAWYTPSARRLVEERPVMGLVVALAADLVGAVRRPRPAEVTDINRRRAS